MAHFQDNLVMFVVHLALLGRFWNCQVSVAFRALRLSARMRRPKINHININHMKYILKSQLQAVGELYAKKNVQSETEKKTE